MTIKKRFIAGAKCPSCGESDSLRVWHDNNIEMVECVECDYLERQNPETEQQASELGDKKSTAAQPQVVTVEQSAYASEQMIGIFKPE
ncbi:YheV family putative metal-binding protein [Vibrio sp. S11_S32]|uniref:YheV family putative zinc ribbon protein n=1 Tax=Vibrio sp. S11_S32 TaxID=2720225 RepID=UPI001680A2F5|nr:YheV family putative zinc ribbon protein [Vibrio sp. S11_S32]MBD1575966.1 YheV family putative metal-binding protein [Vibrio sp. S11_S32]